MKLCNRLATVVVLLAAHAALAADGPLLIPRPTRLSAGEGEFILDSQAVILSASPQADIARVVAGIVEHATNLKLAVTTDEHPVARPKVILLATDPTRTDLGEEGYVLQISTAGVRLSAANARGLFYAAQTLRQLLPASPAKDRASYSLASLTIEDTPRFTWRGYMLDSSRHFVSKAIVLKLLDALAMFKINVFHWHLVDDTAWRLAIAKYPKLTEPAPIKHADYTQAMGFYSAQDIHEIVERARQLKITIVPEIEMPSHAMQAASTLPEASCLGADGKPLPAGTTREICLGSDRAIAALEDILVETMALFPDSPWIHLGGDEAEDRHWKVCSRCQARMTSLGLSDPRLLQKWFMNRMNRFVREHGRTSVAWADRLSLGIPEGQLVHGWHAGELEEAVAKGFHAICSQHDYTYLDYGQGPGDSAFGNASLPTARVYALEPTRGLTPEQARLVVGVQAQLWTELITEDHVFEKTFPRVLALAEVGWTPQAARNGEEFSRRLNAFLPRLTAANIPFFEPPAVVGAWTPDMVSETWKDLEWKLPPQLGKAGPVYVQFFYRHGLHALEVQSAALLENGREISRDEHPGLTGASHSANTYRLALTAPDAQAAYTIRARVKSSGGTDSSGEVLLR